MKNLTILLLMAFLLQGCVKDKCVGVVCQNFGTCNPENGKCICQQYYTGTNCEIYQAPCNTNHTGTLRITSYRSDPYRAYRDGSYYAYISAGESKTYNNYSSQCNSWRFEQASGYVFYPTVYTSTGCVSDCGILLLSF